MVAYAVLTIDKNRQTSLSRLLRRMVNRLAAALVD
jgi:hypothetical protein